jgi:hypothetical protein
MGLKIGDISPAAALMGEDGALRDMMAKHPTGKMMGMKEREEAVQKPKGYKKGGKVRGSGCCKRTKKCKMY